METLRHILLVSEFAAFICSVLFFYHYREIIKSAIRIPFFFGFIFFSECIAMLSFYRILPFHNMLIGNIQIFVQVVFYLTLLFSHFNQKWQRHATAGSLLVYISIYVFETIYFDAMDSRLNSISFMFGSMSIVMGSISFLMQSVKEVKKIAFAYSPMNWIAVGTFMSFTIELCVFSLTNYFGNLNKEEVRILYPIYNFNLTLNALMYCIFSLSFIYSKWGKLKY